MELLILINIANCRVFNLTHGKYPSWNSSQDLKALQQSRNQFKQLKERRKGVLPKKKEKKKKKKKKKGNQTKKDEEEKLIKYGMQKVN